MMEDRYNKIKTQEKINKLGFESSVAFGLACTERLYANYVTFSTKCNWGNPNKLREIIDLIWKSFESFNYNNISEKLYIECERLIPNTEDYQTVLVSSALDAASIVLLLINFILQKDKNIIGDISSLCIDTVDMYIQEITNLKPNDPQLENKILQNSLMQIELQRQKEDLKRLIENQVTINNVHSYLADWKGPLKSNLGLKI